MSDLNWNLMSGTLSVSPNAGATSLSSANFANLPAIVAPDTMRITLDPTGVNGAPEIVRITAHAGGATAITVERGRETATGGGAARTHPLPTTWIHGITQASVAMWPVVCTSTTRPTGYAGLEIYETDTLRKLRHNGTAWRGTQSKIAAVAGTALTTSGSTESAAFATLVIPDMGCAGVWTATGHVYFTATQPGDSIYLFLKANGSTQGQFRFDSSVQGFNMANMQGTNTQAAGATTSLTLTIQRASGTGTATIVADATLTRLDYIFVPDI